MLWFSYPEWVWCVLGLHACLAHSVCFYLSLVYKCATLVLRWGLLISARSTSIYKLSSWYSKVFKCKNTQQHFLVFGKIVESCFASRSLAILKLPLNSDQLKMVLTTSLNIGIIIVSLYGSNQNLLGNYFLIMLMKLEGGLQPSLIIWMMGMRYCTSQPPVFEDENI